MMDMTCVCPAERLKRTSIPSSKSRHTHTHTHTHILVLLFPLLFGCFSGDDFDASLRSVTFQPSSVDEEIVIQIQLTDDDIHEGTEGFVLQATLDENSNDPMDVQNSVTGFTELIVSITNDDGVCLFLHTQHS